MKIKVGYTSILSLITKKSSEELCLEQRISIKELIYLLTDKYGEKFKNALISEETGMYKMLFFVNKRSEKPEYLLQDRDTIIFMILMAGG